MKKPFLACVFLILSLCVKAQNYNWIKSIGSAGNEYASSVTSDVNGNVYMTGNFSGTLDFDPGPNTVAITAGGTDIFIAKYDNNGNYLWAKNMFSTGQFPNSGSYSITTDANGNLYITGYFQGTTDFDPGPNTATLSAQPAGNSTIYMAKYDSNGNYLWAKAVIGAGGEGRGITTDNNGNIYVTGRFTNTADFDPGVNVAYLTARAYYSVFIAKYDSNGNYLWVKGIGSTTSQLDGALSIATDLNGDVYVSGYFSGNAVDITSNAIILSSAGGEDIFVAKYGSNGNYIWAKSMGSAQGLEYGVSITTDVNNNVYVTGRFWGTADFDPGPGVANLYAAGGADMFIAKYTTNGTYVWAHNYGIAGSNDTGFCIKTDINGNYVYVAGYIAGTTDLDPGPGTANLTSSGGDFLVKYDVNGNYIWAKNIGNGITAEDSGGLMTLDALGNVFMTGYFQGTVTVDPGINSVNLTSAGNNDIFLVKYSPCFTVNNPQVVCGSYSIGGNTYTTTGTHSTILQSVLGCDSVVMTQLTVNPIPTVSISSATICVGTSVTLMPGGATSYAITGNTFTISPTATTLYTVTGTAMNGCTNTAVATVSVIPTVGIAGISSTGSCLNGNSGSVIVQPVGSNGPYSYTWTSVSTGSIVSTTQNASGLAPGTYSVSVNSPDCATSTSSVSVNVTLPSLATMNFTYCGNSIYISKPGGSAYQWYFGNTVVTGSAATNDTLFIDLPSNGDTYTVVHQNSTGCKDSVRYTLSEMPGGNVSFSNIQPACSGSNGSVVLNLSALSPGPYHYLITNAINSVVSNTNTVATTHSLSLLAAGGYTAVVTDGACTYKNQFFIGNVQNSFTVVPTNTLTCLTDTSMFRLSFPAQSFLSCGVGGAACTNASTIALFSAGTFTQNTNTTYPTVYANWYRYARTQFLVRKADLNAAGITAGKISSLSFKVLNLNNGATVYPDFSISMACTSLGALPNASAGGVPFISGLQPVYSSTNQALSLGWVTHQFSQSYNWDGQSNLIIELCSGLPSYSFNVSVELMQMPYIASLGTYRDGSAVCGSTATVTNNSAMSNGMYMLPNIRFGYCASSSVSSNYVMSVSNNGNIIQNYNNDSLRIAPSGTIATGASIIYTITATHPSVGCVSTQTTSVTSASLTSIAVNSGSVCSGQSFTMNPSGAHTYTYSSGSSTVSPLVNTTYTVTGTDIHGCISDAVSSVTVNPLPNITVNNGTICSNQTFTIIPSGASTYTYSSLSNTVSPAITTSYTVTGTGASGCVNTTGAISTVSVNPSPTLTATPNTTLCVGTSTVLNASGANTYSWTTGVTATSVSVSPTTNTIYSVTGTDLNNCSSTKTVAVSVNQSCQDVWPGDANSDGTADNFDILELGLHFTQTGPARASTSNAWQSWFANNWTGTISNGKNVNHSDCNGDGVINNNDTLAIFNNYGLTHAFKQPEQTVTNPQLSIMPDQSAVIKGTWGTASVFLGEVSAPITNVNGLAFTVTFDQNLIDANSFYIEYPASFINAGNQNLKFQKPDMANGKLYTATTHTLTNNVSGQGKIAILHYKIKSILVTDEVLNIGITQGKQSNASGMITPLTAGIATVAAIGASVGMDELSTGNSIGIYPNPANSAVTIQSSTSLEKVELLSVTGQIILTETISGTRHQINLTEVANGVYFVTVYDANQKVTRKKLVVQR